MTSTTVSPMDKIRKRCPLLSERMSLPEFVTLLSGRNLRFSESTLDRAVDAGVLLPLDGGGSAPVYTRGHLLVIYQLSRHSRIEWFPWDDRRADRDDLLARRIEAKRLLWAEIESDARCVADFYDWFWGDDVAAFPARTAVRLTEIVRWSIRNIDASGHLLEIARANPEHRGHGPLLLISEMVKLRREVEQLLRNAAKAGIHIPAASEVARDRDEIAEQSRATDEENLLYAMPVELEPDAPDAAAREKFLVERDVAIRTGDWVALLDLLEANEQLFTGTESSKVAWLAALGTLFGEHLDDPDRAATAWRAVLDLRPGDALAITAAESVLDRDSWATLLAEQVDAVEDRELADALLLARARVLAADLGQSEEALEAFGRALSAGTAARADALALMAHLVAEGEAEPTFDVVALDVLASLQGEHAPDTATLLDLCEIVEQRELEPELAGELLLTQHALQRRQGDDQAAFITLSRALSHVPGHPQVHEALAELAGRLDAGDDHLAMLEDELERASATAVRAAIASRLGVALAQRGRHERALEILEQAHQADPDARDVVVQLVESSQELGRVQDAIRWLETLRSLTDDPDARREINEIVAELRSQSLDDPRSALEVYTQLLRADASNEEAIAGLVRLAGGDPVSVAAEAVRTVDPALSSTDRVDELIDLYARLVDHHAAEVDERSLLERLCQLLGRDERRKRIALRRHARLYAMRADPAALASARALIAGREDSALWAIFIQDNLTRVDDDVVRAKLLRQLARTYQEQLRDTEAAVATWRKLLELTPTDSMAFQALRRLFGEAGQWQELVDLSLSWAESVPGERHETLLDVARVLADEVGDLRTAYAVYEQIGADEPAIRTAIDGLISRAEAPEPLLSLLADVEYDAAGERWVEIRNQRIQAAASAGQIDVAIELAFELLERDPGSQPAYERLEQLMRFGEQWEKLEALLQARLASVSDAEARTVRRALAALYREQLERPDEARRLEAELEDDDRARNEAAEAAAQAREALESLESEVSSASDDLARARAIVRLATELERVRGAEAAGARIQAAISDGVVSDAVARAELCVSAGQLAERDGDMARAEAMLKSALALQSSELRFIDPLIAFYRRQRVWTKLQAMLRFRLSRTQRNEELAGVLAELANVAQQLGDLEAAAEALERLLDLTEAGDVGVDPVAVHRNLAGLYVRAGDRQGALEELGALARELRGASGESRAPLADVLADMAALHQTAGALEEARALVDEGLAVSPRHPRLCVLHVDMLIESESLEEASAFVETLMGGASASARLPLSMVLPRLGRLYASRGQRAEAEAIYQKLHAVDPENSEARTFLGVSAESG